MTPDPTGGLPLDRLRDLPRRQERIVTADGAELHVVRVGTPRDGRRLVVLSHCWTGDHRVWGPVARRLVSAGCEVVLYDHRGHGASTSGCTSVSLEALADDLADVLAHVGASGAVVAGHSMGGMTLQAMAGRRPELMAERVASVVLVSTACTAVLAGVRRRMGPRLVGHRTVNALLARGRLGRFAVRDFVGKDRHRAHLAAIAETFLSTPGVLRAELLSAMTAMDLTPALSTIAVPVTVVVGSRDRFTPPRQARCIASAVAGARLLVVPDAGHMLPFEAPDILASLLAREAGADIAEGDGPHVAFDGTSLAEAP
ncbi:MAG TPA: alpha/beta hydrolase [Acidimicrobiaceae bacterium]|nr:alpha/beta hydrolase [Acidimicrobiaceae bacterium]